jgi:hypothetical protein
MIDAARTPSYHIIMRIGDAGHRDVALPWRQKNPLEGWADQLSTTNTSGVFPWWLKYLKD